MICLVSQGFGYEIITCCIGAIDSLWWRHMAPGTSVKTGLDNGLLRTKTLAEPMTV